MKPARSGVTSPLKTRDQRAHNTMQIKCPINQAEAIRRGFDTNSSIKLEVDPGLLSQARRDVLARRFNSGEYEVYGDDRLPEPTVDGLLEALDKVIRQEKADIARAAESKAKLLSDFDADPYAIMYDPGYGDVCLRGGFQREWVDETRKKVFNAAEVELKRLRKVEQDAKQAKALIEEEKKAAKLYARRDALNEFLAWAINNGSETLRLRAEENLEWQGLAVEEWIAAAIAKAGILDACMFSMVGYDDKSEFDDTPTASQIHTLRRIREALATNPELTKATAELRKFTYTEEVGDDQETQDVIDRKEVEVSITTPIGTTVSRYFLA